MAEIAKKRAGRVGILADVVQRGRRRSKFVSVIPISSQSGGYQQGLTTTAVPPIENTNAKPPFARLP